MGDGFEVHERVVLNKMKDLYLAFVVWVIDNKQVHGVVCKQTAACCELFPSFAFRIYSVFMSSSTLTHIQLSPSYHCNRMFYFTVNL